MTEPGDRNEGDRNEADWNEEESRAIEDLDASLAPPRDSEDRLMAALSERGLVHGGRPSPRRRRPATLAILATAAAAAFFAAGLLAGLSAARRGSEAVPGAPRFVLFLFGDETVTAETERVRVAEYKRWAAGLRKGRFVAGEKLGPAGHHLGSPPADPRTSEGTQLRGYFVVEAPDLAHATELARTCPHLAHGGRIVVRPIDPV